MRPKMSKRTSFTKRKQAKVQKVLIFIHTRDVLTNAHLSDIFVSRMPHQTSFSSLSNSSYNLFNKTHTSPLKRSTKKQLQSHMDYTPHQPSQPTFARDNKYIRVHACARNGFSRCFYVFRHIKEPFF